MMNPGQKRSYPFSDDENLADQQVNPLKYPIRIQNWTKYHCFALTKFSKSVFLFSKCRVLRQKRKYAKITRNFRPQKLSKGRLNLKKRKSNLLRTQMLNQTGKSG